MGTHVLHAICERRTCGRNYSNQKESIWKHLHAWIHSQRSRYKRELLKNLKHKCRCKTHFNSTIDNSNLSSASFFQLHCFHKSKKRDLQMKLLPKTLSNKAVETMICYFSDFALEKMHISDWTQIALLPSVPTKCRQLKKVKWWQKYHSNLEQLLHYPSRCYSIISSQCYVQLLWKPIHTRCLSCFAIINFLYFDKLW